MCEIEKIKAEYPDACVGREALQAQYQVIGFLAPYIEVIRLADGAHGSMEFLHEPRVYFNFQEDK